ncbi:MAG: DUF4236 domain-containing protein [Phycisphaerae bacterium]
MGFRFFRRMKIAPGLTLNLSKSGPSLSFGPRGAKVTVGRRGVRRTVGIPGTGLYYTTTSGGSRRSRRRTGRGAAPAADEPRVHPSDRLTLGFFRRLLTPKGEEHFVDGMRALVGGRESAAMRHFEQADGLADASFMAGILALKRGKFDMAEGHLKLAAAHQPTLGRCFAKYGVQAAATLTITDQVSAAVNADISGVVLALAEVYQHQHRWQDAATCLKRLRRHHPDDILVTLSLAELLVEDVGDKQACKQVVALTAEVKNESAAHAAVLLYKAKALSTLNLHTAARDVLTAALRRRRGRNAELLRALRYERGRVYERLGHHRRARTEFEKIYAECPAYEDVEARLTG